MRHYLSFGGGVNSVALHLLMLREGFDFEAVFVDHGGDWPETYEYLDIFQKWLKNRGHNIITVLNPEVEGFSTLYDYCLYYRFTPSFKIRFCTDKFKVRVIHNYIKTPCFMHLGIDYGEAHRAKIATKNGIENRYLLIEHEIDRNGCKKIIKNAELPVPKKSGCYFCMYQRVDQWRELRRNHPCLFRKAVDLENASSARRKEQGKTEVFLTARKKSLEAIVNEHQMALFEQDQYPPCQCGL